MEMCQSPRLRSKSVLRSKKRKFRLKQKAEVTPLSTTIREEEDEEKKPQEKEDVEEEQEEQTTVNSKTTLDCSKIDIVIDTNQDLRPSAPFHSEDSEPEFPQQTKPKHYETICSSKEFSDIPPFTSQFSVPTPKQKYRSLEISNNNNLIQRTRIQGKDRVPLKISWKELSRQLNLDKNTEQNEKIQKILTYYNIILREDLLPPRAPFEFSDDDNGCGKSSQMAENETDEETSKSISSQEESECTNYSKSSEPVENYDYGCLAAQLSQFCDTEKMQSTSGIQGPFSQTNDVSFRKKLLKTPSTLLDDVSKKSKTAWIKARNSLKFALEVKRNSKSFKNSEVETNFEHSAGAGDKKNNNVPEPVNSIQEQTFLQLENKRKENRKFFRWTIKKTRKETLV